MRSSASTRNPSRSSRMARIPKRHGRPRCRPGPVPHHHGLLRAGRSTPFECHEEDRGVRVFDSGRALRAHDRVDVEHVVPRELVEVTLTVRDQPDLEPVTAQLVEHGQRVLVEREVLVALPLTHHVRRALPRSDRIPAHPEHDLLRERDPDLLVVHELGDWPARKPAPARPRTTQDRASTRAAPPPADTPRGLSSGPGPKQGEVDVEQASLLAPRIEDSPGTPPALVSDAPRPRQRTPSGIVARAESALADSALCGVDRGAQI